MVRYEHSDSVIPSMAPPSTRIHLLLFFLLFLMSLSFIIIFFASHPCSLISFSTPPAALVVVDHHRYNTQITPPNFTLILKVLTFNRLSSLRRCLNSLSTAHYDNHTTVHLHIFIDHFQFPIPTPQNQSPKGPLNLDEKLNISREILDFVDGFRWDFGDKLIHYRTSNAGMQAQWLEAWWPASDHEFAFAVEDDMELSPFYFVFLKDLILNFYYNESNYSPMIYGATLERPRQVIGNHGNKMKLDGESPLLLYQLVGTWGQLLFPRPWKEFRLWYDTHKSKGIKPFLGKMVSAGWYRLMGEKIWTPWFIKFVHSRGYFNLLTNFKNRSALSVSHRDAGVDYMKTIGPDSRLVYENSRYKYKIPSPKLSLSSLKWYDFCFSQVIPNRIVRNSIELEMILHAIGKFNTVIVINLRLASDPKVRNLICIFERLAIRNYVFIGPKSALLFDLSRRGHSVIETSDYFKSLNLHESNNTEITNDILVISYVIKKSLELKYNTWLMDSNMIPLNGKPNLGLLNPVNDFYIGESSNLLFTRSSSSTRKLWNDDFVSKILAIVGGLKSNDSFSLGDIFMNSVKRLLEQKGVKYDKINESEYGLYLDSVDSNLTSPGKEKKEYGLYLDGVDSNLTSPGKEKKYVFWSSPVGTEVVRKKLMKMGMWVVDGDLSCTSVYCHASKI